jgi:hypothetical protein
MKLSKLFNQLLSTCTLPLLAFTLCAGTAFAQKKAAPAAPAPKVSAPAKAGAGGAAAKAGGATGKAGGATTTSHSTGPSANHPTTTANHTTTTANHTTGTTGRIGTAGHPTTPVAHNTMKTVGGGSRPVPAGSHVVATRGGSEVRMRPGGRPADVHVAGRNMDIHHGLAGGRRVEVERADHSRLVAERGGRGYVERPYRYGGREFAHRSYYYHGRAYDRYYGHYYYRGGYVNYYTPAYYYRPAFYGWAYNPWVAPVPYAWGWNANPWYGYYGVGFFSPYPVYAGASFWLTDYLISTSLAAAYEANVVAAQQQQAAAAAQGQAMAALPPDAAGLTPEVKEMIANEVKAQIALENQEAQQQAQAGQTAASPDPASSSVQRMLSDNVQHIFVVGQQLDVVNSAGAECAVSQGDALQLAGPPPPDSPTATLVVLTSKGGVECHKSETVTVNVSDLQEMQNHMRETIDQGMSEMQKKGTSLPATPMSASGEPVKASFVSTAPPPDPNVATEISKQMQDADIAEKQTLAEAQATQASGPSDGTQVATNGPATVTPAAQPVELKLGLTIEQVTASLGQPTSVADLGAKKIYIYPNMKVTFKDGVVADIK